MTCRQRPQRCSACRRHAFDLLLLLTHPSATSSSARRFRFGHRRGAHGRYVDDILGTIMMTRRGQTSCSTGCQGWSNDLLHFQLLWGSVWQKGVCDARCLDVGLAVVPAVVVHPLANEFYGRLSSIVLLRETFSSSDAPTYGSDEPFREAFFGMFKSSMKMTFFFPAGGPHKATKPKSGL